MSRSESGRITATFIVRLWTEHGQGQAPRWRGQVEHVQSGEQLYFRAPAQMLAFIIGRRKKIEEQQRPANPGRKER